LTKLKRPRLRPFVIVLALLTIFLGACTGQVGTTSWPGISADGNNVYVAYGPGVLAFDVVEQSQLWQYPVESSTSPFYAAPSVQDGRVIFGDYGRSGGFFSPQSIITIYGIEEADAGAPRELWSDVELASDKIVAPPLQVGDMVYIGTADNLLFALDANTGVEKWRFETGHSVWAQPTYQDGVLYVTSLDRNLYAIDAETGDVNWQKELTGALSGKPVIGHGLIYVTGFDNNLHAIDVETGEEKWIAQGQDWIWSAPALNNGTLYFADSAGFVYAVSAEDGTEIWSKEAPGSVQTSPVIHEDMVYVATLGDLETEQGILVAYFREDGEEVWRQFTSVPLNTTPVVVDDALVVVAPSEETLLIGYNLQTGGQKWTFAPQAE
jgi:outer membrane protein assembly factor BamB